MLAHLPLKFLLIALPLMAAHTLLVLAPLRPHALVLLKLLALPQITVITLLTHAMLIQLLLRIVMTAMVLALLIFQLIALKQLLQAVPSIQLLLAHALKVLLPKVVVLLPALLLQKLILAPIFALV